MAHTTTRDTRHRAFPRNVRHCRFSGAANHVIHYSRSWNPAKEDQATDRAYRIGQEKEVFVYCPVVVAKGFITFDAKLDGLLRYKRELSRDMLNGTGDLSPAEF